VPIANLPSGVFLDGRTCLLLTKAEARTISIRLGLDLQRSPPPLRPIDFVSLSPIEFRNSDELAKKLKSYEPKGKHSGQDDSAANKEYQGGTIGRERGMFEHGRYLLICVFRQDSRRAYLSESSTSLSRDHWTSTNTTFLNLVEPNFGSSPSYLPSGLRIVAHDRIGGRNQRCSMWVG
jgi:hypothetical protein